MVRINNYTKDSKKVGTIKEIQDHSRNYADQKFPNWVSPRGQRFVQAVTRKVEELMQQLRDRALQKKRDEGLAALPTNQEAQAKLQATVANSMKRAHAKIEEAAGSAAAVTPVQSVEAHLKNIAEVDTVLRPNPDHDVSMVDNQIAAIVTNLAKMGKGTRTRAEIASMLLGQIKNGKMTYEKFVPTPKTGAKCASSPLESVDYYLKKVSGDESVSPQAGFNPAKVDALIGNFQTMLKKSGKDFDRKAVAGMLLAKKQLFPQLI